MLFRSLGRFMHFSGGHTLRAVQLLAELLLDAVEEIEGRGGTKGQHGANGEGGEIGVVDRPR